MQHLAAQYFLNHLLEPDEIRRQVREFAAAGYESLYTHARAGLRTPYLSHAWFEAIDAMADEARRCGLTLSLWDEDYFPSPTAGGRVAWHDPNFAAQELRFTVLRLKAGETAERLLPRDAAVLNCYAFPDDGAAPIDITGETGTVQSDWWHFDYSHSGYSDCGKIGSPHIRAGLTYKQFGLLWTAPCDCRVVACQLFRCSEGHGTDLLNPSAIFAFIAFTHEAYRNRYDKKFSRIFSASFMDEPAPSGPFPWTTELPAAFFHDHGFDILPRLGHLAIDIDDSSHYIRHCYRQTVQRLLCESYLDQIRKWDEQNGILSVGHLTRTEYLSITSLLWPNELRCCNSLDIPCTDPLGFYVALPDAAAYHTGLKVVSSAARLFHKKQCGSDALAVMGNETALRDLAYQLDYQITMGATYFNVHGLNYSLDGPRKEETPPSLFYQHSEWPLMRHLLDDARRKCRLVAAATPCQRLAVLYPSTDFYCRFTAGQPYDTAAENAFHQLSELLLSHQRDFDFVDETTLRERSAKDWRKDYDAIILYKTQYIDYRAAMRLAEFQAADGRLLLVSAGTPTLLGAPTRPESPWTDCPAERLAELTPRILATLPGTDVQGDGARDLLVQERIHPDGRRRRMLFNRARKPFRGTVAGQAVVIPPGRALFDDEKPLPPPANPVTLDHGWTLKFPENSVPLPFWLTNPSVPYAGGINLLTRQLDNLPEFQGERVYEARFLLQGRLNRLRLLLEESSFSTPDWQLSVNGRAIPQSAIRPDPVRDCKNFTVDLTDCLLYDDGVPRLNAIRFTSANPDCRLQEMPFLLGDFGAEFRHGLLSLPDLWAAPQAIVLDDLPDWRTIGRGGFSGCARYTRDLEFAKKTTCILDCGRVEDAVELYLDGKSIGACLAPFYRFRFTASAGRHCLELRVWNAPGNRDRWSNLPAGLLGPVTIGTAR